MRGHPSGHDGDVLPPDPAAFDPEIHIGALETAGLIDAQLAARLRQAADERRIAAPPLVPEPPGAPAGAVLRGPTSTGSFFGPSVTVGEMFAYLGVGFLLGAWTAFLARVSDTSDRDAILTGGTAVAAIALFGLGIVLARGDRRRRRGAGAAFLVTTALAAGAAAFLVQLDFLINTLQGAAPGILIAGVAVAVALGLRCLLPAVSTQFGLVFALTGLGGAVLRGSRSSSTRPISVGGSRQIPRSRPPSRSASCCSPVAGGCSWPSGSGSSDCSRREPSRRTAPRPVGRP